jgi:hypothetical protein
LRRRDSDGNPFFIEEMAQALFDEGALVRNGVVKVTRSLSQLRLPPTVQGILAARCGGSPRESQRGANGARVAEELLAALLGDAVELQPLKRLIIERTSLT